MGMGEAEVVVGCRVRLDVGVVEVGGGGWRWLEVGWASAIREGGVLRWMGRGVKRLAWVQPRPITTV